MQVFLPAAAGSDPGQVVHTHVPLSPSSIIWYRPMGGDALRLGRRRTGRASMTVAVSLITGSTPGKGYEHPPTLHLEYGRLFLLVLS